MKSQFTLEIDGKEQTVQAEIIDKKVWFKLNGHIMCVDVLDLNESAGRKSKASSKSPDRILAPMPGKITKIFVSQGQSVQRGDALLVMEAMKMEYTLKSDLNAQVDKLTAQVGDQVVLGQLLVQLKEVVS